MNFKIFEWGVQLDCCGSERREFAGASESSNAHSGSRKCGNFLTSWEPVSFWGRTLLHEVIYLVKHYKYIRRSWLRHCATSQKVAVSIPDGVINIFHWHNPSGRTEVDSASNENEYQEYFLGGKDGRCVRLKTLQISCAIVLKSGSLKILEPSRLLQACNGTVLAFTTNPLQMSKWNIIWPWIYIRAFTKFELGKYPILFQTCFGHRPQRLHRNSRWEDTSRFAVMIIGPSGTCCPNCVKY